MYVLLTWKLIDYEHVWEQINRAKVVLISGSVASLPRVNAVLHLLLFALQYLLFSKAIIFKNYLITVDTMKIKKQLCTYCYTDSIYWYIVCVGQCFGYTKSHLSFIWFESGVLVNFVFIYFYPIKLFFKLFTTNQLTEVMRFSSWNWLIHGRMNMITSIMRARCRCNFC